MKCSARSEQHSCRDVLGQCLNSGDYVITDCCYKLGFNPVKLPIPHIFYRRIAPREELLLNHLGIRIPVWLAARVVHQILIRIQIEQPACAAEVSEKWHHKLNDAIISMITHRAGAWVAETAAMSGGDQSAVILDPKQRLVVEEAQQAEARAALNMFRLPASTRQPHASARSGPCVRGASHPSSAACCKGRGEGETI